MNLINDDAYFWIYGKSDGVYQMLLCIQQPYGKKLDLYHDNEKLLHDEHMNDDVILIVFLFASMNATSFIRFHYYIIYL